MASFWHLSVLAEVFEYNELCGKLGWREPEAKWPGRGGLGQVFSYLWASVPSSTAGESLRGLRKAVKIRANYLLTHRSLSCHSIHAGAV